MHLKHIKSLPKTLFADDCIKYNQQWTTRAKAVECERTRDNDEWKRESIIERERERERAKEDNNRERVNVERATRAKE